MPVRPFEGLGRSDAVARAYELVNKIQAPNSGAEQELAALEAEAELQSWDEVTRAAIFGRAVRAWYHGTSNPLVEVDELVRASEEAGDRVTLALGLAMRSDPSVAGSASGRSSARDEDLARAVVALEGAADRPHERITAHTACGNSLLARGLYELCDEQYALALAAGASEPSERVGALIAPIMFNLAELQVAWAGMLFQLEDSLAVDRHRREWDTLAARFVAYPAPDGWRSELDALGLVLAAMAGEDVAALARRQLDKAPPLEGGAGRQIGLLKLAAALADSAARRPGVLETAESAARSIDPNLRPQLHDLALYVAAAAEAGARAGGPAAPGEATAGEATAGEAAGGEAASRATDPAGGAARVGEAGLRYGRRQLAELWTYRLGALGAMRSRIQAERLSSERELLSRHARLDDLTGIGNRRALEKYLGELDALGVDTVALILLDVDAFKEVNDVHGHLAGDAVLVGIARTLESAIRPSDIAVRLGGDEFAIVLADADIDAAFARAAGFLARIDQLSFDVAGPGLAVAVSAGVAAGAPRAMAQLRAQADAALYRAKDGAGHRVRRSKLALAVA